MKVLLTGATGLIGKEAIASLEEKGCSVVACGSRNFDLLNLDSIESFVKKEKPDYLLHFAWVTGGDYLTNPINEILCKNSFELLKFFYKYGGKKAVLSGTCFEYEFSDARLSERTRLNPKTFYAQKKVELNHLCTEFCARNNLEYAWGRIFYVYGHKEKEGRLTNYIVSKLLNNERVSVRFGQLIRDYMYSKDIANAFVELLLSNVKNDINICTGKGISLGDYAAIIAKKLGKQNLLDVKNEQTDQPLKIIGDNTKLSKEVGYLQRYNFDSAIDSVLNDYKENL